MPRTPLRVILFRAAYNLPVTTGFARGVFARHGLELEIVYTRGSQMTVAALANGDCGLGVLAADDVVYEVETNASDLHIVLGLHGGILELIAKPGLLVNARLGVDDPRSGFALVAHRILARLGFAPDAYETVAIGGHEPRARALGEGRIDMTLSTPPFSVDLVARGFTRVARAADHLPRYLGSCVVTPRRWAAAHPSVLGAYLAAYRESLAWTLEPANRAACVQSLAEEFHLSDPIATATCDAMLDPVHGLYPALSPPLSPPLSPYSGIDHAGLATVLELRVAAGLLPAPPPPIARYL